jgi:thiol-disulfide isomerase/thioredoxin
VKIGILGTGCSKCKKLTELTEEAVNELNVSAEIIKITDINKIIQNYRLRGYGDTCFSY